MCVYVPVCEHCFEDSAVWDFGVDFGPFVYGEVVFFCAEFVGFEAVEEEGFFGGGEEGGGGGEVEDEEEGEEGDENGEEAFDYEDPAPAFVVS